MVTNEHQALCDLVVQLFSIRLRNIRRLSITAFQELNFPLTLEDTNEQTKPNKLQFTGLQELHVRHWDTQYGFTIECIAGLLASPSLTTIHLHQADGMDSEQPLAMNTSVKKLTFTYSCMDEEQISRIIRTFPNLESFEFETGGAVVCEGGTDEFMPSQLINALGPVAKNLKHFSLDMSEHCGMELEASDFPITSLQDFSSLKSLTIDSMSILKQVDDDDDEDEDEDGEGEEEEGEPFEAFFPKTLERLHFTHIYKNMEKPLLWLSQNVKRQLPRLKRLQLTPGDGQVPSEQYEQVRGDSVILRQLLEGARKPDMIDEDEEFASRGADDSEDGGQLGRQILRNFRGAGVKVEVS